MNQDTKQTSPVVINLAGLSQPFASEEVAIRAGTPNADRSSAVALPSVDPRVVQERLDAVLGPQNWRAQFREVIAGQKVVMVVCELAVRCDGEWVTKEDAAHVSEAVNVVNEFAVKGAYGDAFKRAAVMWGVGRYLYRLPRVRVALDNAGQLMLTPTLVSEILGTTGEQAAAHIAQAEVDRVKASAKATSTAGGAPVETPAKELSVAADETSHAQATAPMSAPESSSVPAPVEEQQGEPQAEAPVAPVTLSAQELERVQVQAEVLGQPLPAELSKASAPAPAPAPAPGRTTAAPNGGTAKAPAPAAAANGAPSGLTAEESKLVAELEARVKKLPTTMMRSYLDGPKAKSSLSEASRQYLLGLVQAKEAKV